MRAVSTLVSRLLNLTQHHKRRQECRRGTQGCVRYGAASSTLVGQQAHGNSVTSRGENCQGTGSLRIREKIGEGTVSLTVAVR
jgi:hypothetical protein